MERRHARYSMIREFVYCLSLAQAYLKKVGYLTRSARGVWVLTPKGRAIDDTEAIVDLDTMARITHFPDEMQHHD